MIADQALSPEKLRDLTLANIDAAEADIAMLYRHQLARQARGKEIQNEIESHKRSIQGLRRCIDSWQAQLIALDGQAAPDTPHTVVRSGMLPLEHWGREAACNAAICLTAREYGVDKLALIGGGKLVGTERDARRVAAAVLYQLGNPVESIAPLLGCCVQTVRDDLARIEGNPGQQLVRGKLAKAARASARLAVPVEPQEDAAPC